MSEPDSPTAGATETRRLLVVTAETISGTELHKAIAEHIEPGTTAVRLVAPALTATKLEHAMGDVDEARVAARERLDASLADLREAGINAEGEVGDSDLHQAIADALQTFPADEIVIVAHREGGSPLERAGIEESERDFKQPITELFIDATSGGDPTVAEVEEVDAGQRQADPGEADPTSGNLPPFSPRDLLGIVVAIVGTIVLVVLAASGSDDLDGLSEQSVKILIAGLMGLINLAHIVGLTLFQAGPYRGAGRKLFANISLIGTPLAIVICLILG